jgi:hypothetical protein
MLIGGGPDCQLYYREIVEGVLGEMGVGMLPEEAFGSTPFCTDWLDTTESQRLLDYQRRDFDDYLQDMLDLAGFRRHLIRLFRPIARWWLLRKSPAYRRSEESAWAGKVAVITGASSGIGAATAKKLAREGLRVVLVARRRERLEEVAAEIQGAGGEALVVAADLTEERERVRVFERVQTTYGVADVVINNAGFAWYGFGESMDWALARQMIKTNISAVTHLTLLFLPAMKARNSGHIINMGSIVGSLPSQGVALYGATKAFQDAFTTALYRELRGTDVRVSVVKAGAVSTEFYDVAQEKSDGLRLPAGRLAIRPGAVADRIWGLVRRPRRAIYVPRLLSLVPWVELAFGWLLDRLGPLLLRRQRAQARG